jgi:prolyl oligopeptidase
MPLSTLPPSPVEEVIHGVLVPDPYRWLEDRGLPETEEWIADQQQRSKEYFAECGNLDALRSRVREYLDVEVLDQPAKVAGRYFYRRRDPGQEQASIYVRDIATGHERLLVDSTEQGVFVSVGIYRVSEDGSLLAYELKHGGEDKKVIHIVDVETGHTLSDRLETGHARGFVFTSDKGGFYYCHEMYAASEEHAIRLHRFHDPGADQVVFRVTRTCGSRLVLTADDLHLGAIWIHQGNSEPLADFFIAHRNKPSIWKQVFAGRPLTYSPILSHGRIFAISYDAAPNGKLVELNDDGCEVRVIIPERSTTIRQLVIAPDRFYASYYANSVSAIQVWNLSGEWLSDIDVPTDGTIQILPIQSQSESGFFYSYESFTRPPAIFEYRPETNEHKLWHRRSFPTIHDNYRIEKASFHSKDGTDIPLTLVVRKSTDLSRQNPVIMTGYGGFGVPMTPQFSVFVTMMLEFGAIFALPHIRGGGEFGKPWHEAARGRYRQTAVDDFLAAAAWLCTEEITSTEQLGIFGGSNSGLLVGAAMTQRPRFFRAVLCVAPLLDMVRYERFDQASRWRREYGSIKDYDEFQAPYSYSPYHHVQDDVDYPATLFVSGDKDDRCNPAHVRKTSARLQDRIAQKRPVLVDYSSERGHSPVLPLSVRVAALARRIGFLCRELNVTLPTGGSDETTCA